MFSKILSNGWAQGLSTGKGKKIAIALLAGLLLALPLSFAVANPWAMQSATSRVQGVFSGGQGSSGQVANQVSANQAVDQASASQAVMSHEEGIAHLTCSDLRVVDAAGGTTYSLAVLSDGTLWAWGWAQGGRLGNGQGGTNDWVTVPTQVGTDTDWRAVAAGTGGLAPTIPIASFGIKTDGTLWSWGNNRSMAGQGGGAGALLTPTQVGTDTDWEYVTSGQYQALALRSNDTLWSWGLGRVGSLGHGNLTDVHAPTQVGTSTWRSISAGEYLSVGVQSDGTLWSWGATGVSAVGTSILGRTVDAGNPATAPGQIGTLTTWDSASAGYVHSLAIQDNGTLWNWGRSHGLGGQFAESFTPVQVGTSDGWKSVSASFHWSLGLKEDGSLWSWGDNGNGQTGLGIISGITSSPTQVDAPNTWEFICAGNGNTALAIRSDGTLWGWGAGMFGNLGQSPVVAEVTRPVFIMPVELEVTSVTPVGNRVSINASEIVITFSHPVSLTAGTRTVTLQGDELDTSAGTWSVNNTVLTLPIPDLPMPYETVHTVIVSGFMAARGGVMCADYVHNFITEAPDPVINLTKILQTPAGTTLPASASFVFEFERVQVRLSETPAIDSRPIAEVPVISNQTIAIDSTTATTTAGVTTATGSLDLWPIISNLDFPGAGYFVWDVTEQANTTGTTAPSSMSYDDARFQVRALVDRYGDLYRLDIHSFTYDEGTWTIGPKLDSGPTFTNTYTRLTSDPDSNHLVVTKDVTGEFANLSTLFNFTLVLAPHALAPIEFPLTATIIGADNNPVAGARNPVNITGTTTTFQLAHGERLQLPELPVGTTFMVTEAAHTQFAPEVEVIIAGASVHTDSEDANTALSTGPHVIGGAGRNAADFTNDHQFSPPTGLNMSSVPVALVILAVVAFATYLAVRSRRRIEQLPIV
ncbi:MAG: hypothetical protein FWC99_00025 [Coriobacteriia bacterium]|nr:hypothetical protein [Coriobacteriia bacterium]